MRLGLFSGLALGLMQDMLSLAKGHPVSYVDLISRQLYSTKNNNSNNTS